MTPSEYLRDYEAMFEDGVTRVYVLMTPDHARAIAKGRVPPLVKEQAKRLAALAGALAGPEREP
jgi:hypothetical protein